MWRTSSSHNKLPSNIHRRTYIAQTWPRGLLGHGQTTLSPGLRAFQKPFPIANWCRHTNQCDYTVNMLRPCHQNPALSAFKSMEGSFSFDATPMAPPETEVLVHLKPVQRKSWSFHASNGWYIGPSLKHYRCIRTIMEGTGGEQLTGTFCFKHHAMPVPTITSTDRIVAAACIFTDAISGIQEAPPNKMQAIISL
jgi:hypothetical protein